MWEEDKGMDVIPFKDDYISVEQAKAIIAILFHQCNLIEIRETQNEIDFPELYDEDYMFGRKHSYTANVYAGFQEDTIIPGMTVTKIKYGRIHCQPQIESETAILQIYSSDATLKIDEIKAKCAENNLVDSKKHFCVFQFWTSRRGHLTRVEVVHFNDEAEIISRRMIYKNSV